VVIDCEHSESSKSRLDASPAGEEVREESSTFAAQRKLRCDP